jgi:hypothetical protein
MKRYKVEIRQPAAEKLIRSLADLGLFVIHGVHDTQDDPPPRGIYCPPNPVDERGRPLATHSESIAPKQEET